jgi:hypothetical protein
MKNKRNKGSALVLALFAILMFMTMVVGFTYDARSQATYNAGFKLNSYYQQSARSILADYGADQLPAEWIAPPSEGGGGDLATMRFGALLQQDLEAGKYGIRVEKEGQIFQNMNNIDIGYTIWVANNQDDPAVVFAGTDVQPGNPIQANWDTDSKVVVTVEVYDNSDPAQTPRATVSAMFGSSGYDFSYQYNDVGNIGSATGDVSNQGNDDNLGISNLDEYR